MNGYSCSAATTPVTAPSAIFASSTNGGTSVDSTETVHVRTQEVRHGVIRDESTPLENHHAICDPFGLAEHMRIDHDRRSVAIHLEQHVAEQMDGERIQAAHRLVEEKQPWPMYHALDDSHLLFHPFRAATDQRRMMLCESQLIEKLHDARVRRADAAQLRIVGGRL
jgi:hypothetical protein